MVMELGPGPEFDLIRSFLRNGHAGDRPDVLVGPGDDCTVVTGAGIALTVDMVVEDVHFRRSWMDPAEIGYHAAAGALSDLAAMAARPVGVLAAIALGPGDEKGYGREVMEGVRAAADAGGAALLGGDVTRSPRPLVIDIAAVGEAAEPVLRSGAAPGQELWVTGELGGAAAAVERWLAGQEPERAARLAYTRPPSRAAAALWLKERGIPTAMVDLSDGIAGDAGHIAAASGLRVVILAAALPVAAPARGPDAIRLAAAGGEDYELCFAAEPGTVAAVKEEFEAALGVGLTRVGRTEEGSGAVVIDAAGETVDVTGFQHWGDR